MKYLVLLLVFGLVFLFYLTGNNLYFISLFFVWFLYLFSRLLCIIETLFKPNLEMMELELIQKNIKKANEKKKLSSIYEGE